jgi:hypothetical protein
VHTWMTFWKVTCILGIAGYYLLVLFIIPFAIKDLVNLMRKLSLRKENAGNSK